MCSNTLFDILMSGASTVAVDIGEDYPVGTGEYVCPSYYCDSLSGDNWCSEPNLTEDSSRAEAILNPQKLMTATMKFVPVVHVTTFTSVVSAWMKTYLAQPLTKFR